MYIGFQTNFRIVVSIVKFAEGILNSKFWEKSSDFVNLFKRHFIFLSNFLPKKTFFTHTSVDIFIFFWNRSHVGRLTLYTYTYSTFLKIFFPQFCVFCFFLIIPSIFYFTFLLNVDIMNKNTNSLHEKVKYSLLQAKKVFFFKWTLTLRPLATTTNFKEEKKKKRFSLVDNSLPLSTKEKELVY